MKNAGLVLFCIFAIGLINISAQNQLPLSSNSETSKTADSVEKISSEITQISKSLKELNLKLQKFTETFSSNQGLKLSERQQKILAAFEFLNRAEQRLLTLQNLKASLSDSQISFKGKLGEIEDNLRQESIDRSIAFRGTTNAEELRENRRRTLTEQKNEINQILSEIQDSLNATNKEFTETILFLDNIRRRIFPAIEKEISDL